MDTLHVIVLAIIQGISEFLPISSSGHLILVPHFLHWPDQGLAFDAAIHIGTLAAVILYFRVQLAHMASAWLGSLRTFELSPDARLGWAVLWGTIPVGLAGLLFNDYIEKHFRSPLLVASTLSGYGILLWLADWLGRRERDEYSVSWRDAMIIGIAQALALVPGTSRSGVTMTAGLTLGFSREAAARFSFLLAVPGTALAALYECWKMSRASEAVDWQAVILGILVAAASGFFCIHILLRFIQRTGMWPFTVYRLALAAFIVYVFA
ncbi:MAG TPA: undecaprenyl-diphosphate phosphatase [Steroidobacteraceae bacterium]|nr:undecaprenyl-diphosphate phosphatase [Steroidobacteraceae bacterium]